MALIKADRVKETSTSETTANFILGGAATGYRTFSSVCAVGDTFYYAISNQSNGQWEVGLGTYGVPNILERTTVHASSNAGNKVNFSSGTKECFISATKAWLDTFVTQTSNTTNYIAKTTGTGTIGDSQIYDNGTVVGIGTSSPTANATLTIKAAAGIAGIVSFQRSSSTTQAFVGLGNSDSDSNLYLGNANNSDTIFTTNSTEKVRIKADGNVGIGTTSPSTSLTIATNAASPALMIYKSPDGVLRSSQQVVWLGTGTGATNSGATGGNEKGYLALYESGTVRCQLYAYSLGGGNNNFVLDAMSFGATSATAGQVYITPVSASTKAVVVRGASAQFANLQEWQNNSGTVLASIASDGGFSITNSTAYISRDSVYTDYVGQLVLQGAANNNKRLALGADTTNNIAFLQSYINSVGPAPLILNPNNIGTGSNTVGVGNVTSPDGQFHVTTHVSNRKVLVARAHASQSVNIQEWQNSSGNAYAAVNNYFGAQFHGWSGDGPHGGSEQVCLSAGNKSYWASGDAALMTIGFVDVAGVYDGTNWSMYFKTGSSGSRSERMRITHTGNVGINTTTPTSVLTVKAASSSTHFASFQNTSGTAIVSVYSSSAGHGQFYVNDNAGNAKFYVIAHNSATSNLPTFVNEKLEVTSPAAATKGLIVKGASGQSANLQEWQNNSGTALAHINSSGILVVPEIYAPIITDTGGIGYYKQYFITRTLPDTVGDYVEFLEYAHTVGTRFKIDVMAADYPYWDSATYEFNSIWDNGSYIMPPKFRYHRNTSDLVLEKVHGQSNPYASRLRLRRIGAKSHTGSTTVRIRVEVWASQIGGLPTDASATGTSTLSSYGSDQSFCNPVLQAPPQLLTGSGSGLSLYASNAYGTGSGGSLDISGGDAAGTGTGGSVNIRLGNSVGDGQLAGSFRWGGSSALSQSAYFYFQKTMPASPGDYVEVCNLGTASTSSVRYYEIEANVYAHASWYSFKRYQFVINGYDANYILQPQYADGNGLFELELAYVGDPTAPMLRIRRTAASGSSPPVYIHIKTIGGSCKSYSGTGTSTIGNSYQPSNYYLPISVSSPYPATGSGNANSLTVSAGPAAGTGNGGTLYLRGSSAAGTGSGGDVFLQAGAYATSGSNGKVIVRGLVSNTANLQEWQNNAGTALASVSANGAVTIAPDSASAVGLTVKGASGLTTNLQEWRMSDNVLVASITDSSMTVGRPEQGYFYIGSSYHSLVNWVMSRNVASATGSYTEILKTSRAGQMPIEVVVNFRRSPNHRGSTKVYKFAQWTYDSGYIITPINSYTNHEYEGETAPDDDFELELITTGTYETTLRIRRTVSSGADVVANIFVKAYRTYGGGGTTFSMASGTGTSSISLSSTLTDPFRINVIRPALPAGFSGNGNNLSLTGGNAKGTGNGGDIILQAGAYSTSGSNGKVIVRGLASNTANLQEWQNNAGTALAYIRSNGTAVISPVSASGDSNAGLSVVGVTNDNDSGLTVYPNNLSAPTRIGWSAISFSGTSANINVGSNTNSNALYCRSRVQVGNSVTDYSSATLHVSPLSTSSTGISVRAASGQTANLQEWQNSSGTALALVDASGNVRTTGSIQITSNTPAAFTVDQNDLALSASGFQRLSGTAARNITGIAPPSGSHVDGRMMRIYNVGSYNLTLKHNSTASSAPNRFFNVQSIDIIIGPNDYAELIYDGTNNGSGAAGWRVA